jgi:HTH-type transcriptional regulator/antitoxin HipB
MYCLYLCVQLLYCLYLCVQLLYCLRLTLMTIEQISKLLSSRRKQLQMEQKDMYMRIGMKQQQYQRIEAGSDMKLSTLLRVLDGLNMELTITAKESNIGQLKLASASSVASVGSLEDDSDDLGFWFGSGSESGSEDQK